VGSGLAILITGAASGIGAGVAAELARSGHHLIVSDVKLGDAAAVVAEIRAAGGSAEAVALDVTSDDGVAAALRGLSRPCDVLINNAGLQHVAPLEEFPVARWDFLVQVMLVGTARLTRAVLPGMRARGFGRIINVGSIHSLVGSPYKSAYVAAKHGLLGFAQVVALSQLREDAAGRQTDRRSGPNARDSRVGGRSTNHAQTDAQRGVHRL